MVGTFDDKSENQQAPDTFCKTVRQEIYKPLPATFCFNNLTKNECQALKELQ